MLFTALLFSAKKMYVFCNILFRGKHKTNEKSESEECARSRFFRSPFFMTVHNVYCILYAIQT